MPHRIDFALFIRFTRGGKIKNGNERELRVLD